MMNKKSIWIVVLGVLVVSFALGGFALAQGYSGRSNSYNSMMGYDDNTFDDDQDGYYDMGSMMSDPYDRSYNTTSQEPYSLDVLTQAVEEYIAGYDEELIISDIFIFSDSDYYYAIMEKDTGKGAMELLVDPYTKAIYPEYGPNMMWNLKYGMHSNERYMRRGMMGNYYDNDAYCYSGDFSGENDLNAEEAYNEAVDYLAKYAQDLVVGDEYHEFYGYYTFHVLQNGKTVGMMSVNGYTGEVWYHNWHGKVIDVIEASE